jgi:hypothetical protein
VMFDSEPRLREGRPDHPVTLPERWRATAILHPPNASQLCVARLEYDWSNKAMRIELHGFEKGRLDFLIVGTAVYLLVGDDADRPDACYSPVVTRARVPAPDWLSKSGAEAKAHIPFLLRRAAGGSR